MKILVIDSEQRSGSLLCKSLHQLGHQPVLSLHPREALERLDPDIEAVICAVDLPAMTGPALAAALRARRPDLALAFCAGRDADRDAIHSAEPFGFVLTAPWSRQQMQTLVENLRRRPSPALLFGDDPTITDLGRSAHPGVELTVHDWAEVEQLCRRRARGPVRISVAVPDLDDCCPVAVTLLLPDGFSLELTGEVVAVHRGPTGTTQTIFLSGLEPAITTRLAALAAASPPPRHDGASLNPPSPSPRHHPGEPTASHEWLDSELARGTGEMKVSEIIRGNRQLKAQIESLARKMRPR